MTVGSVLVALAAAVATLAAQQPVTSARIQAAAKEPQNWLTYSGSYNGQRYTTLDQITPANVKNLNLEWVFQVRSLGAADKFEATPIVVDGIMYTVSPPNDVVALDAVTGRQFWRYNHTVAQEARPCCGRVNRGVAILGNSLFLGTLDGRVVALNAKTGEVQWNVAIDRPEAGYALTVAPLVVKDKVIVGPAGGEFGIRGYIVALDPKTGKELWRFYTVPAPGEPGSETWSGDAWKRGGGPIWTTGSYDPELNLMYWGVGNPGPDWNGDGRPGDNLYTDSVIALDPDTGKLKWHYQYTPHDEFDYDATQIPVLADIQFNGQPRKVLMQANRNGVFYVLDRTNGQFLKAAPFTKVNWVNGWDAKGRPNRVLSPTPEGTLVYPNNQGATNWYSPSFSPRTGLFYIPTWADTYSVYRKTPGKDAVSFAEGQFFAGTFPTMTLPPMVGAATNTRLPQEGYGTIQAVDPKTGERKWEFRMLDVTDSGILSTATDLVFAGGREGYFFALDARTGTLLWKSMVGGQVASGPMSYAVNGKQYVAVSAGNNLFVYALRP
ncbi:MAG TPA: PQQ-dependent dehydrogenase, methanol/ethanol family [Vicinamibacterales bacterium]|nr:PQQ-dependent dehydrogenase, methanol/ethanol family [Vicinamibacterales bacterium]